MLGLQNEREWALFCSHVLQRPELATSPEFASNSRRVQNRQALRALINEVFSTLTAQQVVERLEAAQIANARINDMHDLWRHEQLQARARWVDVGTPAGPVPALLPPGLTGQGDVRMDPVPALGEHTEAILAQLGYSAGDVAALRERKAV
jgi:itaconate CoA-transferase